MHIRCPHCNEDINLDLYKKPIRQWVNTETANKRMTALTPERRKEIAKNAIKIRWEKHKMDGEKIENPKD